jgi:nucleoside-diphosphate-sugar epimerase
MLSQNSSIGYSEGVKVLIAGASGFIGKALIEVLLQQEHIEIVALSRKTRESHHPRLQWKRCDLFSMKDIHEAMRGCEQAYYLVHSMLPSATLSQGSFYDYDLILADNFVRCSKVNQIKHLIYLGGMIPPSVELSWHLKSRLEVEETLQGSGILTTTLRAGLVIGERGSSFEILRKLVERLPLMVCPAWTLTESQPIALSEMIEVLVRVLLEPSFQGRVYDVGGPEVLTYQALLLKTAEAVGKKRRLYSFNLVPLGMSRLWVTLITGSPRDLVYPLVLSLKHRMVADPLIAWGDWRGPRVTLSNALRLASHTPEVVEKSSPHVRERKFVRSVQRLYHPTGKNAAWLADEYFRWLPKFLFFIVRVQVEDSTCRFYLFTRHLVLLYLEKSKERSTPDRQLLYVRGGLLASSQVNRGRLEFREALQGRVFLAALHDFMPSLPWVIYRFTQAIIHLFVMKMFDKHLKSNKFINC